MNSKIEKRAREILSSLTLKEKIGQLVQYNYSNRDDVNELSEKIKKYALGSIIFASSEFAGNDQVENVSLNKANELQKAAVEGTDKGIPLIICSDVIHGHNTIFPINLAMAGSFNPQMVRKSYECIREEALKDGINLSYAPMLYFCHDPRWGRIIECQGEDPYLASKMAEAIVKGFQSDDISNECTMAACAKHFIGYGASEGGRDYNHTEISDYSLYNYYLPAFRAAVNADVASVMNSFNEINGVPVAASKKVLTDILRDDLGFEGFVVSDWGAIWQLHLHAVSRSNKESAKLAINAGIDIDMVNHCYLEHLEELINEGEVSMEVIDRAVFRVLYIKIKMGLFEKPYQENKKIDFEKHFDISKKMCENSMVLLKNENSILPLKGDEKIYITGPHAFAIKNHFGSWAQENINAARELNLTQAIAEVAPNAKIRAVDDINSQYFLPKDEDVIICVLGEPKLTTGEANSLVKIELPPQQVELVRFLKKSGKPVIGVLCFGRPVSLEEVEPLFDAMIYAWHGGSMATVAIADVLFGKAEPSGRLAVTLPRSTGQIPLYYNALPGGRRMNGYYGEVGRVSIIDFHAI